MGFATTQSAYVDLRDIFAERSDSVVIWVGAGLSVPAGIPTWDSLRKRLVGELRQRADREEEANVKSDLRHCADEANVERNLWNAFGLLREKLGPQSYQAEIRKALNSAERAPVPNLYKQIWQLRVSGVLNLNIDRLAARAFNECNPGKLLHDFTGNRAGDNIHLLRSTKPWLANLHGILDETPTWVFTTGDLKKLYQNQGYRNLISACFTTRTVVFVGITADDVAAGGHLAQLGESGLDCGGHFWITSLGSEKREWAEKSGIRLIQYSGQPEHSELNELFDDLLHFTPTEAEPDPVRSTSATAPCGALPPPDKLLTLPAAEIRTVLNAHASRLLDVSTPKSVAKFEEFATKYSEAIYRAWFASTDPAKNDVLGYRLIEHQAEGAFGAVYRAVDSDNQQYAVKILHERVRSNREMLQSFRRGVHSMRLLTDANVPGVVGFYDASEIPAMVVMDFIEGINLSDAVRKGVLREWSDLLRIVTQLTAIIRTSHRLPQRVLHRDIRPANVMLEHCWGPNPDWHEVKLWVLDFDLSYHLDAFDVSISHAGSANGYLAPEQVNRSLGVSTRNAAVDSFGLGMTFYFLRTAVEPRFSEHRYGDWKNTLEDCALKSPCITWVSLPRRFARLVFNATRDRQEDRLDVANIENELIRLRQAESCPSQVASAELMAEEIAARAFGNKYEWDDEKLVASKKVGPIQVDVRADERNHEVHVEFVWLQSAYEHHQDVKKWLPRAKDQALAALRNAGWKAQGSIATGQIRGEASIRSEHIKGRIDHHAEAIEKVTTSLNFGG